MYYYMVQSRGANFDSNTVVAPTGYYCDDDGVIEMDNNGPIVPCPFCGGKTMKSTIFKETWIESNEDEYFQMLGAMPPAYHFRESEMLIAFLLGEPYDHSEGQPRYHAFLYLEDMKNSESCNRYGDYSDGHYYRSRRPMTVYQFLFEMEELK